MPFYVKTCESCCKECETREVTIDDSFYYEYGEEARTHRKVSIEEVSECCDALVIEIEESKFYADEEKGESDE